MGVIRKMAKTAREAFTEFYSNLVEVLPINDLLCDFYTSNLLSSDDKAKIDDMTIKKEKVVYFLDNVIKPGLEIGYTEQFDEMVRMMETVEYRPVKYLAGEIRKFLTGPTSRDTAYDSGVVTKNMLYLSRGITHMLKGCLTYTIDTALSQDWKLCT